MKVYAPNKNYTGVSAGVAFCNGMGETNNSHLLEWFKKHGYKVEETVIPEEKGASKKEESEDTESVKEKKVSGSKKAGE